MSVFRPILDEALAVGCCLRSSRPSMYRSLEETNCTSQRDISLEPVHTTTATT